MKAYKGFNKDMTCRGFQFEEGKTYQEDTAKLCESGFHAYETPMDCLRYYPPTKSVYHEVELDDVTDEHGDDTKRCGKIIKIGAKLNLAKICNLHFEFVKSQALNDNPNENNNNLAGGDESNLAGRGNASSGENSCILVRGNGCKAKGGLDSVLVIVEENKDNYNIKFWKAGVVDGNKIKADTWYTLDDQGEFVEVSEND